MRVPHFSLALFLATAWTGLAQDSKGAGPVKGSGLFKWEPGPAPFAELWRTVRDQQPAGLHLTLTLPKTHYYLGSHPRDAHFLE